MILHMLAVAHRHYGEGIAKAMTHYCLEYAKAQGYKGIRLDVVPGNYPAKKLYEACGLPDRSRPQTGFYRLL